MTNDLIIDYSRSKPVKLRQKPLPPEILDADWENGLERLEFSVRTANVLKKSSINTIRQLYDYGLGNIRNLRGLGAKGYKELVEVMYDVVPTSDPHPFQFHVGASRILNMALDMDKTDHNLGVGFLRTIWPEMTLAMADMVLKFPKECRLDGAYLKVPESWGVVTTIGEKK